MDINELIPWIIGLSSLLAIVRIVQATGWEQLGWLIVHAVLLLLVGAGLLWFPESVGGVLLGLWIPFVLAPNLCAKRMLTHEAAQRYGQAAEWARWVARLHPADGWPGQVHVYDGLHREFSNDSEGARASFQKAIAKGGNIALNAQMHLFQLDNAWEECAAWGDRNLSEMSFRKKPTVLAMYARALGETGRIQELLELYSRTFRATNSILESFRPVLDLMVCAFTGDIARVERLFATICAGWGEETKDYWRAYTLQRAGRHDESWTYLASLDASLSARARESAERLRDEPQEPLTEAGLAEPARATLEWLRGELDERCEARTLTRPGTGKPRATLAMVSVLVVVFATELSGGSEDPENLLRMGALFLGLNNEWWRYITAGLLHFGIEHLAANLLGLWFLGRVVENRFGAFRFFLGYFVTGLASFVGLAQLHVYFENDPVVLVGASGSIMGLFGILLADAGVRWIRTRSSYSRGVLLQIGLILVLQIAFDLSHPQVSFGAHMLGVAGGVLCGLLWSRQTSS